MPSTGSTFTDWQQVDNQRRLLIDEDFSWSEPPARARRPITGGSRRSRHLRVVEPEPMVERAELVAERGQPGQSWDQPTQSYSHFDEMMEEWNRTYGDGTVLDLSHERDGVNASGPRTVVITGHGDDRYVPAARRRRSSELRFHERAGFSPDRTAMWAVMLGVVLLIVCIAH